MADVIGTRPTSAGLDLLTRVISSGAQLTFTRGAFGDSIRNGSYVNPTAAEQLALTALIHEKLSLPIADLATDSGNSVVELLVKNANVQQTFQVREIGLFARDPDNNQEVLYCYVNYGDTGFIMPAPTGGIVIEFFYRLITAVGAAENVTAVIDRTSLYTTLNKFLEHVNATLPHPNFTIPETYTLPTASPTIKGGIKVGANLFMSGDSLNAENSYVLPTASTSTKGGAKVGYGLIMQDDTLNVAQSLTGGLADSIAALELRVAALEEGGTAAVVVTDLVLDTSADKSANFQLSGSYSLTSDGYFTLS